MSESQNSFIQRWLHRRALSRWTAIADAAPNMRLASLRKVRARALAMKELMDRVLFHAEGRLALPVDGSKAVQKPLNSDWAWRPEVWRGPIFPPGIAAAETKSTIGSEVTLFHDCKTSELTVRQVRNRREEDIAPFGLQVDVFRFDGSFMSLVINLPKEAVEGLTRRHIVRMEALVETEQPMELFARLNVRHGPNSVQLVRELPLSNGKSVVEFDLAYTELNEKRVDGAWVDLIFEGAEMNQVFLRDVTFSRRPRAEM
ncbi:MAG: hypothetical protein CR993_05035 [Rhodobacterales bacterium]|nr:MAG: hypothetical protein CR993_05035 [Rhodobacterales bacterium]